MSIRPWRDITRRQSRQIMVGNVPVGGDAPVTVQTMTNTPTSDAKATIDQIRRCEDAGVDIIRVSCPDVESTAALKQIVRASRVPIVADIHFHYKRALEAADAGAACLRISPGNSGSSDRVREVVNAAKANGCAIRIGVNAGSLEKDLLEKYGEPCPEALVESALDHIKILQDHDFHEYKVAVKASDLFLAVAAYQQLAEVVDCPLHLGITEAGGFVKSTPSRSRPNLQFHFLPTLLKDHGREIAFGYGYTLHVCDLLPKSRGRIGLTSPNPLDDPLIDPSYLSAPEDIETMVAAVKIGRQILSAPSMAAFSKTELVPGPAVQSKADIVADIRRRAETIYHPVGTCRMGRDPQSVVDPSLRVRGVQGLRVVDASVMPTLVAGNTNAPTMMIAERAAELILGETKLALSTDMEAAR